MRCRSLQTLQPRAGFCDGIGGPALLPTRFLEWRQRPGPNPGWVVSSKVPTVDGGWMCCHSRLDIKPDPPETGSMVQEIPHRYPTIPSHLVISRTGASRLLLSRVTSTVHCELRPSRSLSGLSGCGWPCFSSASPVPSAGCRLLLGLVDRVIYRGLVSFFRHFDPLPSSPILSFCRLLSSFLFVAAKSQVSLAFYLDTRSFPSSTASIHHHRSIVTRSQPSQAFRTSPAGSPFFFVSWGPSYLHSLLQVPAR